MRPILYIIFLLCCHIQLQAQSSVYLYDEVTVKEGLAKVTVNFVQQDSKGFMWLGGNSVVQRYDGYRFQNFYIGKGKAIPGGDLQGMSYDSVRNRLWLLTGNKYLGYIDANKLTYHPVKIVTPPGFENVWLALQVNKRGEVILIYVDHGLVTYNEMANEVAAKYNAFSLPRGWEPIHVWQDEYNNYWIATRSGLIKYNASKKLLSYPGHNDENDPVIAKFGHYEKPSFIYVYQNLFWIQYSNVGHEALYSFNSITGEQKEWNHLIKKALGSHLYYTYSVQQYKDGSTWFTGIGLFAQVNYQQHSIDIIKPEASGAYSIRYDDVINMYQDRELSNWVCTNKGLFRFNPTAQVFRTVNNSASGDNKNYSNQVTSIIETSDGEILAATWGDGIFSYNPYFKPIVSKYFTRNASNASDYVMCLLQTRAGDLWQAYPYGILKIYNAATKKSAQLSPEAAARVTINQMAEDQQGNVWLGTKDGRIIKWNAGTQLFSLIKQCKRPITRLYVDSQNRLWACTDNDGVFCFNAKNEMLIQDYSENAPTGKALLINGAYDILQYNDSIMVIASNGLNILNTKTGKFKYMAEGTPIKCLVLDKNQNLWFAFNNGIACCNILNDKMIFSFDARDGIGNIEFKKAAALLMRNGNIAIGTSHDMLVFNPALPLTTIKGIPSIYASGIYMGSRELPVDSVLQLNEIALHHNQNAISFHFTNNQFQNLQYIHYRVLGLSDKWKRLPGDGELNLNYLPPGKYILQVTSLNEQMQPQITKQFVIRIAAPFYKTGWFYSLIILLVALLLYVLDRERSKRKEAMQQMRSNIANNLHKEVNTALNNINILSEMSLMKAAQHPKKAIEFVQQIQNKSNSMINALDDMLWAIDPQNDSMEKTLDRMREFIDAEMNRIAQPIDFFADESIRQLNPSMQMRHEAFIIFKKSITGLLDARVNNLRIKMTQDKGMLLYSIECGTEQAEMQQLNYMLQNNEMAQKLEALNAKLDVQVHKSRVAIECKIPIR